MIYLGTFQQKTTKVPLLSRLTLSLYSLSSLSQQVKT